MNDKTQQGKEIYQSMLSWHANIKTREEAKKKQRTNLGIIHQHIMVE